MRQNTSSQDTLTALLSVDPKADYRQIAMLDCTGTIAIHTGAKCLPAAGSYVGNGFATLANMVYQDTVWGAMAEAYTSTQGDFPDRLMAALYAAQGEGGDMRGKQTAAMLIVDSKRNPVPILDLRVDHHPEPLDELARLIRLQRAYMAEYKIAELAAAGADDAVKGQLEKIATDAPQEQYLHFLSALHLAAHLNADDEAVTILKRLFSENNVWHAYLEREAMMDNFGIVGLGKRLLEKIDS